MCGICGFVTNNMVSENILAQMNSRMKRRGPDDHGEEIFDFGEGIEIGLGHRRLSIQDLSKNGHQPFHSSDTNIVLVFNGEIYNFIELRKELNEYPYISSTDTEVIIAAYARWGENFLDHLKGMFALALWDKAKKKLILARDRLGKKPLYYFADKNNFVFASTLSSLIEYPGITREIDKEKLPQFLLNKYISGRSTILKNIYKVLPGEKIVIDDFGLKREKYWDFINEYRKDSVNPVLEFENCLDGLDQALKQSVRKRLISDVPVGTFLSGGIDSSLVTAIAQSVSDQPLNTFSIGFDISEFDEAPKAKMIADYLGTNHETYYVTQDELIQTVDELIDAYDEPFADPSEIPSLIVAKIAADKVKVVLTGDGGDEIFAGYGMYDKLYTAQKLERMAALIRPFTNYNILTDHLPYKVSSIIRNKDPRYKTQLGREQYHKIISNMLSRKPENYSYDESSVNFKDWVVRRMLLDSITYLPDNNLCKVDRSTMHYSLEARNPLLDTDLIEFAFTIPQKFKYNNGKKKYILKELAYRYIPKELLDGEKKGFAAPINSWLRGPLKNELLKLTDETFLRKQDIFDPDYTIEFINQYLLNGDKGAFTGNNPSNIIWPFFVFQKWYQKYFPEVS